MSNETERTAVGADESSSQKRKALEERQAALRANVCEQLASDMESMGAEWVKEWSFPFGLPHNPITGNSYKGGNVAFLLCAARQKGYSDPRWCTFNNARKNGWHVRKGERATPVECWKKVRFDDGRDPDNDDREDHVRSYMKLVSINSVFNFEQIEGAPPLELPEPVGEHEAYRIADALIDSSRCPVDERPSDEAYYSPWNDRVTIPMRGQFSRPEGFVATLLHEMGHSTGPEFGREQAAFFLDEKVYSKEEMVAELSSVFSATELGIGGDYAEGLDTSTPEYSNHVAYLKHYASMLREDPDILFKCAAEAQKSTDSILARYEVKAIERGLPLPASSRIAATDGKSQDQTPKHNEKTSLAQKFSRARTASEEKAAERPSAADRNALRNER